MAYYYKDGSGIDSSAYIYVQLQVTRTDYPTYSHFSVKSVAVSDTGSSSFIRGQVTTNQAGNSWTAATGWKDVYYNGTTTLATATFDVTRGASDKTARIGAYAEGGGTGIYAGGTDYAWLNVTVPKVLAPNAPTGCTATYVSDSQASVSWTNGATDSDHPRDATLVERRDGSNDWTQVASASGTASGYTDNGISANTQYQYRVRAKNVAGYSAYSTSGSIYTTPTAPSSVTLDKTAATTVQVDVTGTWGYAVTYDIESTYDGGSTWASVATSTSLPYSATVNAGTVQFRVRAVRGELASAWTLSASLVTICPPLAPTIVQAPANPTAYGDSSAISWTPNHPDGSAQASAEVKVTNPGGTSTTYTVSTATSYSFTPNATGTWTAQVRTKGLDPSYGDWSQAVSWVVATPPAVVITSPATDGTDVVALPLNVAWTVTDSTGVSTQRIIIEGSDGEILNRTLAGDVRTLSLTASDLALEDGGTYTIRLRVMGGSGLVTEQTRIFDVAWLAPAAPVLQLTEGEGRSATIDVMDTHYSESGSTIAVDGSAIADSFTVFGKSTQDGTPTPSAPVAIESVEGNLYDPSTAVAGYLNANGTIAAQTSNNEMTSDFIPVTEGEVITVTLATENYAVNQPWICFIWYKSDQTVGGVFMRYVVSVGMYWKRLIMPAEAAYVRVSARHLASGKASVGVMRGYRWFGSETHDGIDVVSSGRNIADPSATFDYYIGYSSAPYDTANIQNATALEKSLGFHPVSGGQSISLSVVGCTSDMTSTSNSGWIRYVMLGADYSWVGAGTVDARSRFTYTTDSFKLNDPIPVPSDARWLAISFRTYGGTPCIRLDGSNEYVPYDGDTYPIDLQGNSLRSLPDGTRDELRVGERKVLVKRCGALTLNGSESWTRNSVTANNIRMVTTVADLATVQNTDTSKLVMSSMLSSETAATAIGTDSTNIIAAISNHRLFVSVPIATYPDVAAWTTALTSTPMTVVYKLDAPQEIDLGSVSDYPFIPEGGEMWVDGTEMEAVLRPADYAGQPTIQSVDVQRVNADGTAWTVATGLTVGGSCIDPLPPLGVPVTYRATSSAASGSTASGEFTETFGGRDWVLNFGNAAQEHVEFIYNPQADLSLAQGGKGYHFADGGAGNGLPVFYPTTDRDYAGTLKFDTILYGDSDKVLDLCDRYPVAWLRDPFGHRWRAHVAPSVSHGVGQVWPVTLSWDAMRFEEAWDG